MPDNITKQVVTQLVEDQEALQDLQFVLVRHALSHPFVELFIREWVNSL